MSDVMSDVMSDAFPPQVIYGFDKVAVSQAQFAWLVEGKDDSELPEQIAGCASWTSNGEPSKLPPFEA